MPTPIDQRRLRTGENVLRDTAVVADTIEGLQAQLAALHHGIVALQSLDDMGEEANARAFADMRLLEDRYIAYRKRLVQLEGKESP